MKFCFIAGANSIHSSKWITYFAKMGHEVHWISLTPQTEMQAVENITLYHFDTLSRFSLFRLYVRNIKSLIQQIQPDILHAHYAGMNGLLGAMSGFHPYIVTAWGSDVLFAGKSRVRRPFVKYILNKADLITCDAIHMKDAMVQLGIAPQKIEIIYFGIDTQRFHPRQRSEKLRTELGVGDRPTVISLRSLEPIYDVGSLIRAMSFVVQEIPRVMCLIAGHGSEEEHLKRLVQLSGIQNNVTFLGYLPSELLPNYIASSDVYISTSLSDGGIAASTAEAMACGVPVVITDFGENREWVDDGEGGIIIPLKSPEILAEKIIYLLRNPETQEKLGNHGRKIIEERNDYYKEMARMEALCESVASI